MRFPGMKQSFPMYLSNIPHVPVQGTGYGGHPDLPGGFQHGEQQQSGDYHDPPFVAPLNDQEGSTGPASSIPDRRPSILKSTRPRGESLSAMNRRVDFSLGMGRFASGDLAGDVYADRERGRIPIEVSEASRSRDARRSLERERASQEIGRSTSRDVGLAPGGLARRSTEGSSRWARGASVHRNRFFGRPLDPTDEQQLMEQGNMHMAGIPENPATARPSPTATMDDPIDPRTGMVDSRAWRSSISMPRPAAAVGSGALPDGAVGAPLAPTYSYTSREDFEMRRL